MKKLLVTFTLVAAAAVTAGAQDVREAARKAEVEKAAALERAAFVEEQLLNDRVKLLAEVEKLEAELIQIENEVAGLGFKIEEGEKIREKLADKWAGQELEFKELSGNVRVVARDLETILRESPVSALVSGRIGRIKPLFDKGYFPGIDDITGMADVFFDEIERSGQIGLVEGSYVGRDGEDRSGRILTLGKFTAIYREGDEVGFLSYGPESQRLFALSALPPRSTQRAIKKYLEGKSDEVPIDISGGAALRQITRRETFREHLASGGPVMWPIGLVALSALGIVLQRVWFLNKVRRNTGKYMTRVNALAAQGDWDACEDIVRRHKGEHSPVNHVIEAGLRARHEDRETLESILQEAILRELPRVERGLPVLAILGAVAPLLGLLGTVTGMIETFQTITLFGTGDPKLMSGGISEALVTTEVGLMIAIPVMLCHTYLSRRAEAIVGEMEEKAVSLSNIIERERTRNAVPA